MRNKKGERICHFAIGLKNQRRNSERSKWSARSTERSVRYDPKSVDVAPMALAVVVDHDIAVGVMSSGEHMKESGSEYSIVTHKKHLRHSQWNGTGTRRGQDCNDRMDFQEEKVLMNEHQ